MIGQSRLRRELGQMLGSVYYEHLLRDRHVCSETILQSVEIHFIYSCVIILQRENENTTFPQVSRSRRLHALSDHSFIHSFIPRFTPSALTGSSLEFRVVNSDDIFQLDVLYYCFGIVFIVLPGKFPFSHASLLKQ